MINILSLLNYKNLLYIVIFGIAFGLGVYSDNRIMSSDIKEKDLQIAQIKAEKYKQESINSNVALNKLYEATNLINDKAKEFQSIKIDMGSKLDGIRKDLKNVKTPLPVDCKPDIDRMRLMSEAVNSVKQSAAR